MREVAGAKWIAVHDVTARQIVQLLEMELEEGEAEAIALAHELGAEVVLLDSEMDGGWQSSWVCAS